MHRDKHSGMPSLTKERLNDLRTRSIEVSRNSDSLQTMSGSLDHPTLCLRCCRGNSGVSKCQSARFLSVPMCRPQARCISDQTHHLLFWKSHRNKSVHRDRIQPSQRDRALLAGRPATLGAGVCLRPVSSRLVETCAVCQVVFGDCRAMKATRMSVDDPGDEIGARVFPSERFAKVRVRLLVQMPPDAFTHPRHLAGRLVAGHTASSATR